MDKDLMNIKLMVADRLYPLSIDPSEEESFRLAAKKINEMIQTFERHYDLRDKQDAIAMCAIVLARQASQEKLNEDDCVILCHDVAKRIEAELEYPGQIKVVIIRETRMVDYAK